MGSYIVFTLALLVQMLENLVIAMESEAQVVDIVRVSGFMQKVRPGLYMIRLPRIEFS